MSNEHIVISNERESPYDILSDSLKKNDVNPLTAPETAPDDFSSRFVFSETPEREQSIYDCITEHGVLPKNI